MIHLFKIIELGIFVSVIWTVWEENGVCEKQYMCALDIYLMTVLSSLYGIIMDSAIDAPDHGNNVVDCINATD